MLYRSYILRFFSVLNTSPTQNIHRSYLSTLSSQDGQYSETYTTKQPHYVEAVHEKTVSSFPKSHMMISTVQGAFLKLLVQVSKVTKVLELGTFTGYSALCMAEGLKERGPEAKIVTLEKNPIHFKAAKENIESSGLGHLIELKHGDATDLLLNIDNSVQYDLIFIDADKSNYINYYNTILERNLLSDDGVIVADNVLFYGYVSQVAKINDTSQIPSAAKHLHLFNEHVVNDWRTTQVLLPCFDGLMLIRKK